MNGCAIGVLTYEYAYLLKNGNPCADNLFCKLAWLIPSQATIDSYIPVGKLISTPEVNACSDSNTVQMFAPLDINLPTFYDIVTLEYNGSPIVFVNPHTTIIAAMDEIIDALTTASGVQWQYTQIGTFDFILCSPYTQNGDTVFVEITITQEFELGLISMDMTMADGEAPETPARYQTAEMNCITTTQYDSMVETSTWITNKVKCCDKIHATPSVDACDDLSGGEGVELREDTSKELRELGN